MTDTLKRALENRPVKTSAPCRVDMGGTLDISTFHNTLRHLSPGTFNIAIDLRTHVRLLPYKSGMVKVSSKGFAPVAFTVDHLPFDHPLGLMFAVAAYFRAGGVHIEVRSTSPPRSALGGSSVAAVALVAALSTVCDRAAMAPRTRKEIALLAQALEASVAGVPCGLQDQLAAAFGGVNVWRWKGAGDKRVYDRRAVVPRSAHKRLARHLLLAYCGIPHASKDVNSTWVRQFLSGDHRERWNDVVDLTRRFVEALGNWDIPCATSAMNRETEIRREMTPQVIDIIGDRLVTAARGQGCGARFTGAGGGGCIWALGDAGNIETLRGDWAAILSGREHACLLDVNIDSTGLMVDDAVFKNR